MPCFKSCYAILINNKPQSFGLRYLKPRMKTFLDKGFALYEDSQFAGYAMSGYNTEDYRQAMTYAIEGENKSLFKAIKQRYTADLKVVTHFQTYANVSHFLQQKASWDAWEKAVEASQKAKFHYLKKQWLPHAKWAHYTTDGLLLAADLLAEFDYHYHAACVEFNSKQNRLPEKFRKEYGDYLTQWGQQLSAEKHSLQAAMLYRFEQAVNCLPLLNDDVIAPLVAILDSMQVKLPASLSLVTIAKSISSTAFCQLYQYLHQQQDVVIKKALNNTKVLNPQSALPLALVHTSKQVFIVPQALADLIPIKPKKPTWLFKGHQLRYNYFQHKADLLIQLTGLENMELTVTNPLQMERLENEAWVALQDIQITLIQHYQQAAIELMQTRGLFQGTRQTAFVFLKQWQQVLLNQRVLVIKKQLAYLAQFLPALPSAKQWLGECLYTDPQKDVLVSLLNTIKRTINELKCLNSIPLDLVQVLEQHHQQLNHLRHEFEQRFNRDEENSLQKALNKTNDTLLFQIVNDRDVPAAHYQSILQHYKSLENTAEKKRWCETHGAELNYLYQDLEETLALAQEALITSKKPLSESWCARIQGSRYLLETVGYLDTRIKWADTLEKYQAVFEMLPSHSQYQVNPVNTRSSQEPSAASVPNVNSAAYEIKKLATQPSVEELSPAVTALIAKVDSSIQRTEQCLAHTQASLQASQSALTHSDNKIERLLSEVADVKAALPRITLAAPEGDNQETVEQSLLSAIDDSMTSSYARVVRHPQLKAGTPPNILTVPTDTATVMALHPASMGEGQDTSLATPLSEADSTSVPRLRHT